MKKLLAFALCAGIFTTAKSQIYVQGGVNLANITKTKSGDTQKENMLTSFNAGVLGRFNLSEIIDIETGLLVDGRGSKVESGSGDNYYKATFNPLYLEVPANLVVRFPLEKHTNIFVNAGPYVAMGIAGKSKVEGKVAGVSFNSSENIKWTSTDPTSNDQAYSKQKRFDYGLNFGAGVDLGTVLLKANYGMGLAKINSTQTNNSADAKNKYRTISISIGIPITGSK
ncbi:MAG: porin family protein [Ginsengibacter sp.]|jgi:hypothetical protein